MSIVSVRRALALSACLLLAACGASPLEPEPAAARASAQTTVAPTAPQGGGMPWYQATTAAPVGGGMPWY